MKRKILLGTLLCVSVTTLFIYDSANSLINFNKEYIEQYIESQSNQKVKLGDIHLSFDSLKVSTIDFQKEETKVKFKEVELFPNSKIFTSIFSFDPKQIVGGLKVDQVIVSRPIKTTKVDFDLLKNDYSDLLPIYNGLSFINIKQISDPKFLLTDFSIVKKKDITELSTYLSFMGNNFSFKGSADIHKFLTTKKLDAEIVGVAPKLDLKDANHFINDPDIKVVNGFVHSTTNFNIKDNTLTISGENQVNNFEINFFGYPLRFEDHVVKTSFSKHKAELIFPSKLKINNTDLDVEKITVESDGQYENLKNVVIESKNLKYYGKFSDKFNKSKGDKEISIDFNLVDLNYLNYLGILNIPKPFSDTMLKNGTFKFIFYKDSNNNYKMTYKAKANGSLKVDAVQFQSDAIMEGNQLSFANFTINNAKQEGSVKYHLTDEDLFVNANLTVDEPILRFIKNRFGVPYNINLKKNNFALNFDLQRIKDKYIYNGSINLANNDFSVDYGKKTYNFKNSTGSLNFSTHNADKIYLTTDSIAQGTHELNQVTFASQYKNGVFNSDLQSDLIDGKLDYNKNNDSLELVLGKIDYDLKHNEKAQAIIEENAEDIEQLKNLELPKKIKLIVEDSSLNDFPVGKIVVESTKNIDGTGDIKTSISNPLAKIDINSLLDLKNLKLSNNVEMEIPQLGKFNQEYKLKDTIKDGNLLATGKFETQLTNLDPEALIHNTKGKINFESYNGEFMKVNTGAGFILNLLSFQTIPNLIILDFKNVFNDKLTYDHIYGDMDLNGYGLDVNHLKLESKISTAKMNGKINLDSQEMNLNLMIEPKITRSILFTTVSAASVINPAAFLGASILEKLIPLPEIVKYNYKINGTFSEPKYEQN